MEPTEPPIDRMSQAALVVRTIETLDASTEEQRDSLLGELLCAAWGSIVAQNQ